MYVSYVYQEPGLLSFKPGEFGDGILQLKLGRNSSMGLLYESQKTASSRICSIGLLGALTCHKISGVELQSAYKFLASRMIL